MCSAYNQLLDATIQHLEDLKSRGVRHVAIAPETLRALAQPAPRPAVPSQELRSSRHEEAQIPLEKQGRLEPPYVGSYFLRDCQERIPGFGVALYSGVYA